MREAVCVCWYHRFFAPCRACALMFSATDPYDRDVPIEPGIHPDTLITLIERVTALACAQYTRLRACALPAAWVESHLAQPGSVTQLDILLKNGGWSSDPFSAALLNDVGALCGVLAQLVVDDRLFLRLYRKYYKGEVVVLKAEMAAWRKRALLVLAMLAVNLQPRVAQARLERQWVDAHQDGLRAFLVAWEHSGLLKEQVYDMRRQLQHKGGKFGMRAHICTLKTIFPRPFL